MQKIDKTAAAILSTSYKTWLENDEVQHEGTNRYYYDDVAMNLYKCQSGVCAYTEMHICTPELYAAANWDNGRYKIPDTAEYKRIDHLGEMDHFDPKDKKLNYWNWDNLFMIHPVTIVEIQNMIDQVLYLNHGVVRNERRDYINILKSKKNRGEEITPDRFFTSVKWTLSE